MDNKIKQDMSKVYLENQWNNNESRSGSGSSQINTQHIEQELPYIINKLSIKSILDIPCGDFAWMPRMLSNLPENITYHGADIVEEIIENNKPHTNNRVSFSCLDITSDKLPKANLVLVRDCLNHLPTSNVFEALRNIKKSRSKYIALTNFNWRTGIQNHDVENKKRVEWRKLNFTLAPFFFDNPIDVIVEGSSEVLGKDKTLAIWKVSQLKTL